MILTKFGPKHKDHPSIGELCQACGEEFKEGDYTTLVSLGPGKSPEDRMKRRLNQAYTAVAIEVHWSCATGDD